MQRISMHIKSQPHLATCTQSMQWTWWPVASTTIAHGSCWHILPVAEAYVAWWANVNTLRPRQNGRHFADAIFKWMFLNENVWIPIKISLKFIPKGPINNILVLVQIMAWHRSGNEPLSEPMMVRLLTHICVARPQWVNTLRLRWNWPYFADYIFDTFLWVTIIVFWFTFHQSFFGTNKQ